MLELTFLGSGNAFTPSGRYWSSFLANGRYLFDAPPTLLPHLKRLGRSPNDLNVVFLSHFHGDHFMGLPFLFLEYLYMTPRQHDLYVAGPPGTEAFIEGFTDRCFPNLSQAETAYRRVYIEADPRGEQAVAGLAFRAVPMKHAQGKLDCFGYKLALGEKTLAYSGDTEYCDAVYQLAEGADVLVLDCTYADRGPEHMGLSEVREVRKRVSPQTTLLLTHLEQEPNVAGLDNVIVAQDFATYRFP